MAYTKGRVFRAKESFAYMANGTPTIISAGQLVREGHPLLKGNEHFFEIDTTSILEVPGKE